MDLLVSSRCLVQMLLGSFVCDWCWGPVPASCLAACLGQFLCPRPHPSWPVWTQSLMGMWHSQWGGDETHWKANSWYPTGFSPSPPTPVLAAGCPLAYPSIAFVRPVADAVASPVTTHKTCCVSLCHLQCTLLKNAFLKYFTFYLEWSFSLDT